jgi:hypothetical protein
VHVHHGRHQDRAGDVGVDEDGGGEAEAYLLVVVRSRASDSRALSADNVHYVK